MALGVALSAGDEPLTAVPPGNRRRVACRIVGDASYPTNGSAITALAAQLGLQKIDMISLGLDTTGVVCGVWSSSTSKLKMFSTNAAPVVEVANATDLSALHFPAVVWGL